MGRERVRGRRISKDGERERERERERESKRENGIFGLLANAFCRTRRLGEGGVDDVRNGI